LLSIGSSLFLTCHSGQRAFGPSNCTRVIAPPKCKATEFLKEVRALDGAAVLAQLVKA
jgi:hypothetical protein